VLVFILSKFYIQDEFNQYFNLKIFIRENCSFKIWGNICR